MFRNGYWKRGGCRSRRSSAVWRKLRLQRSGESGRAMSTIEEVRAAEKKVQELLDALKKAGAKDPNNLSVELKNATDEYARAVRELSSK